MRTIRPLLLLSLVLSGCSLAPNYQRPATPVATAWSDPATANPAEGASSTPTAEVGWREFFTDPRLQRLIAVALEHNRDLRVAALNLDRIRALYDIQRTALIPSVSATANGTRQLQPADLSSSGAPRTSASYRVGLAVTAYEVDLFGRVASLRDQVLEQYLATDEARRSVQLTLVAAVATQYLTVVSLDEQLALARQTHAAVKASFDINRASYDAGVASELDLRTAEAQLQTARANLALYTRQRAQAENALNLLLGHAPPADLPAPAALAAQNLLADLPAGLPSDLLQRRPDILRAEHTLKAANANIGIARAAFFPSITLTAFGGTSSAQLDGLFKDGSGAWSFTPQITLPLFAAGRNRANLKVSQIEKDLEVARYEQSIQTAFREVSDTLIARTTLDEQLAAQTALVSAQQSRFDLTDLRYRNGADSYLVVLLAQQDLYAAQQALIQTRLTRLANLITLYKALGGGWQPARS
jgi:multidrug efflux system outer membrane protein